MRTAADALACDAVGAVVLEVWGEARQFDLVASRKLTLAAQASGVTGLVLRIAAEPQPSTAETRWIVRAAHSPPAASWSAWGAPCSTRNLSATVMALLAGGSWNGNVMSAFSGNRRRILSLWLPRLPIDRIKRQPKRLERKRYRVACSRRVKGQRDPSVVVAKQNNALQISALDERPRISALRSACRSRMPAPSARR